MTDPDVTMCVSSIYDREINCAANVAPWWWFGALGLVCWSSKESQGLLSLKPEEGTEMLLLKIDTSCQIQGVPPFIKQNDL